MYARKVMAVGVLVAAVMGLVALFAKPAPAIPLFAHQFEISCAKCHSVVPKLNEFGLRFRQYGYHLPKLTPDRVLPISVRGGITYASDPIGSGLPKLVVDELVLSSGGQIGQRFSYYVHHHIIDTGTPGQLRQASLTYFAAPYDARIPLRLSFGSYELPTPVSCEEFRETVKTYAIFDQTVGSNAFSMCAPKIGFQLQAGDTTRGTSSAVLVLRGSEPASGVQPDGTDTMFALQHVLGPFTAAAYQYNGRRPDGAVEDEFHRLGFGLIYSRGRWESDNMLQDGWDSSINGAGMSASFSGGFAQLRYAFNPRLFALTRYEGTNDELNGFSRTTTLLLGYRLMIDSRLTVEDVISHVPTAKHTLGIHYLFSY